MNQQCLPDDIIANAVVPWAEAPGTLLLSCKAVYAAATRPSALCAWMQRRLAETSDGLNAPLKLEALLRSRHWEESGAIALYDGVVGTRESVNVSIVVAFGSAAIRENWSELLLGRILLQQPGLRHDLLMCAVELDNGHVVATLSKEQLPASSLTDAAGRAASDGKVSALRALLAAGVSPDAACPFWNARGSTTMVDAPLLHMAIERSIRYRFRGEARADDTCVDALLDAGCRCDAVVQHPTKGRMSVLEFAMRSAHRLPAPTIARLARATSDLADLLKCLRLAAEERGDADRFRAIVMNHGGGADWNWSACLLRSRTEWQPEQLAEALRNFDDPGPWKIVLPTCSGAIGQHPDAPHLVRRLLALPYYREGLAVFASGVLAGAAKDVRLLQGVIDALAPERVPMQGVITATAVSLSTEPDAFKRLTSMVGAMLDPMVPSTEYWTSALRHVLHVGWHVCSSDARQLGWHVCSSDERQLATVQHLVKLGAEVTYADLSYVVTRYPASMLLAVAPGFRGDGDCAARDAFMAQATKVGRAASGANLHTLIDALRLLDVDTVLAKNCI